MFLLQLALRKTLWKLRFRTRWMACIDPLGDASIWLVFLPPSPNDNKRYIYRQKGLQFLFYIYLKAFSSWQYPSSLSIQAFFFLLFLSILFLSHPFKWHRPGVSLGCFYLWKCLWSKCHYSTAKKIEFYGQNNFYWIIFFYYSFCMHQKLSLSFL